MVTQQPHFLLFFRADTQSGGSGVWRFRLESTDGKKVIEASDSEPNFHGERLEVLAVVRGLEALEQPSKVTLVTSSRRISHGFRYGLNEWRSNDWQWERDGRWIPIKNGDLWRRVDWALKFHYVQCRIWRSDAASAGPMLSAPAPCRKGRLTSLHAGLALRNARPLKQRLTAAVRAFIDPSDAVLKWSQPVQLSN